MNAKYTDQEKQAVFNEYLVLLCQDGDANALQELMSHWHGRLYGYALGQLQDPDAANEATQESLVSISKSIHRLKDPASFPKWAYQIVIRRCADWQRKEIRWRARHVTGSASAIEPIRLLRRRRRWRKKTTGKRPVVTPELRSNPVFRKLMLKLYQMFPDENSDEDRLLAVSEAMAEHEGRRVDDRQAVLNWLDDFLEHIDQQPLDLPI